MPVLRWLLVQPEKTSFFRNRRQRQRRCFGNNLCVCGDDTEVLAWLTTAEPQMTFRGKTSWLAETAD